MRYIILLLFLFFSIYQCNRVILDLNQGESENNILKPSAKNIRTEHSTHFVPIRKCRISGVYNQLCLNNNSQSIEENDTKFRHYFNCLSKAICGYWKGKCSWFKTKQFNKCLKNAKDLSVYSEIRTISNLLAHPSSFSTNPIVALSDPLNDNKSVGRAFTGTSNTTPRELFLNMNNNY